MAITRKQRDRLRRRSTAMITAAAPAAERIVASWEAEISITAEPSNPQPSAALDNADADGGKRDPGANGGTRKRAGGKPPTPRFNISAYNGGPMRLNGYMNPIIVDGAGIVAAAKKLPIYVGHCQTWADPETQMEQLFGQSDSFDVDEDTGEIEASGIVTGESDLCKQAMAHAANGFKFQASINARPDRLEYLQPGVTTKVNGRNVTGPMVIARAATCDHIALVPLGADTSTAAQIAASAAKGTAMEFAAWLTATYALDAAKLTPEQKTKLEAEFKRISASAAGDVTQTAPQTAVAATVTTTAATTTASAPTITAAAAQESATAITAHRAAMAAEDKRIADVRTAAKEFPVISAKAVAEGWSVDKTELEVLRESRKAQQGEGEGPFVVASGASFIPKEGLGLQGIPADRNGRHIAAGGRISNELCAVIECAGLISAGYHADRLVKNPAYGQRAVELADAAMRRFGRGLGPMGLMRLCASFAGVHLPHNNDDALRVMTAEFSTLNVPVILSNLMNKFLLDSYMAVDPDACAAAGTQQIAWQQFTKRGPLQDFKPHYRVRLASNLEFKDLGPTGEIQHGQVSEQSYSLQADTKAILFALTRKDIVNDDLSAMSTLPTQFGRGAGIRVAKFIYALLIAGVQSDHTTAFFTNAAVTTKGNLMQPNLIATNALSFPALEAAEAAQLVQTDPYGQPAGIVPEILLCPPGIKNLAMQLWQSKDLMPSLGAGGNLKGVPQSNTLAGRFRPVCSQWLASLTAAQATAALGFTTANAGSNTTWYLAGGPQQAAYPIEAGFLNGQEMPIVERDEMQFDRLGVSFRGFIDFGGNLAEPRSIVKNTA